MDRHERIDEQLANVPLFSGLSKKELRLISQLATYLEEPAGTVLTEEGKARARVHHRARRRDRGAPG